MIVHRSRVALLVGVVALAGCRSAARPGPAAPPPTIAASPRAAGDGAAAARAATPSARPAGDSLARVAPGEVRAWLDRHPGAVLLDVRTPAEYAEGHVPGAVLLDVQAPDFAARAATLARGTPYVVYCRSGVRAERAGQLLRALGHAPVVNAGGFEALVQAGGFPRATGAARP